MLCAASALVSPRCAAASSPAGNGSCPPSQSGTLPSQRVHRHPPPVRGGRAGSQALVRCERQRGSLLSATATMTTMTTDCREVAGCTGPPLLPPPFPPYKVAWGRGEKGKGERFARQCTPASQRSFLRFSMLDAFVSVTGCFVWPDRPPWRCQSAVPFNPAKLHPCFA